MERKYVLSIDQSTQGTKALLFDEIGKLIGRHDILHKQYISEEGYISHNLEEIYTNTINAIKILIEKTGIEKEKICYMGISNQRETTGVWNKITGEPLSYAIVWQCSRAKDICEDDKIKSKSEIIKEKTGIPLSPYFPASKILWFLKNIPNIEKLAKENNLCFGTIDSWLIYKLTKGKSFKTDFSNASRTQLFNIEKLKWDEEILSIFGIDKNFLPEVCSSNSCFGETDLGGILEKPIKITGVLGDSHGALFGQGCFAEGMAKITYGTGSSIMLNTGNKIIKNKDLIASLAWGIDGIPTYVLEGNINYAGAVVTWLKDSLGLIKTPAETEILARKANFNDETYLVPAFTGLGTPYWNSSVKGILYGISRFTGKNEIVKAGLDCIAYQVNDILEIMNKCTQIKEIRADGGITKNKYLMQFQSDISEIPVKIPDKEELSGIGAAYMAGLSVGLYDITTLTKHISYQTYNPLMDKNIKELKWIGWKKAINSILKTE